MLVRSHHKPDLFVKEMEIAEAITNSLLRDSKGLVARMADGIPLLFNTIRMRPWYT